MAKLNKEAVGQYNFVVADDTLKGRNAFKPSHDDVNKDASVELVVKHPKHLQLLEPPKLFETNYHSDFRPPPKENLIYHTIDESKKYSIYNQRQKLRSAPTGPPARGKKIVSKSREFNDFVTNKNRVLKSLIDKSKGDGSIRQPFPARARTAEPAVAKESGITREQERKTADFQRAIVQGQPDWKHKEPKSYDVLNPEKPNQLRETNPYGARMENMQESVAQRYMEDEDYSTRSNTSMSILSDRLFVDSRPQTMQSARTSRLSGKASAIERASNTDPIELMNPLTTIQEEDEDGDVIATRRSQSKILPRSLHSAPDHMSVQGRSRVLNRKPKNKPVNLYVKKVPDKRFYRPSKIRQTPNEMNQYKKMRNRTFFKPLEQAIPEKDFTDHETKYQPERQLLQDARWKIRQDLKDVRTKNINSLVDRFAQRAQLKNEENRGRLGLPTYAGRDPVSIYKLRDTIPKGNQPQTDINVTLPVRRRITPSIGSVQRARNLSTYANVWNQPSAPPNWGPQKVDHGLFLPPMAVNT
ncbi:uncharacterized protein LOC120345686 isoform X2 [Styela clava]